MKNLVLIHGTEGRSQLWHLPGSEFIKDAEAIRQEAQVHEGQGEYQ